jgi:DNA-directed RNA polymerase specialized sigma24 family protein
MEIAMGEACPRPRNSIPSADAEAKVSQLYRENSDYVLSYVTGLLRVRYLAENVVQETMLRAWPRLEPGAAVPEPARRAA